MTGMRDFQPEAFEFETGSSFGKFEHNFGEFESDFGQYESRSGKLELGSSVFPSDGYREKVPLGEFEWETSNRGPASRSAPPKSCTGYQKNEVQKSRTAEGHLASDVISHPRGLLIADFGVDWRTPRESLMRETALQNWLRSNAQVIQANPTTKIRILGFSDCVGNERNNRLLREGRAIRARDLLGRLPGTGPQWNLIKSKIAFVGAAPAGEYISDNDTIEGRAKNRSVLIESSRTITYEPTVATGRLPCRPALTGITASLSRAIPDDPNYHKHIPLNYRLDAKRIVEEVTKDIGKRAKSAHFWQEVHHWADRVHWGIVFAEIFHFASALAIASPLLAAVLNFMNLGVPYLKAAEQIAANESASGFSHGVVMGADGRSAKVVREYFGNRVFPPDPNHPQGASIARTNYRVGLLVGFVQGRLLCPNQRQIFWRDLGQRMEDQSYRGPQARWTQADWCNWYTDAGHAFRLHHL